MPVIRSLLRAVVRYFLLLQVSHFAACPAPNPRHTRAMVQWSPLMIYTAIKIALYKIFCGWLKPKPSECRHRTTHRLPHGERACAARSCVV